MQSLTQKIEEKYRKTKVADVKSGDTVRVHQKIKEGSKERTQVFEGLVINTKRTNSHNSSIVVRRISSGVGVEKSFLLHSPLIEKVEIVKRSKVNRNYLTYMRNRSGKAARLDSVDFDSDGANEQSSSAVEEIRDEVIEEDTVEPKAETPTEASEETTEVKPVESEEKKAAPKK